MELFLIAAIREKQHVIVRYILKYYGHVLKNLLSNMALLKLLESDMVWKTEVQWYDSDIYWMESLQNALHGLLAELPWNQSMVEEWINMKFRSNIFQQLLRSHIPLHGWLNIINKNTSNHWGNILLNVVYI